MKFKTVWKKRKLNSYKEYVKIIGAIAVVAIFLLIVLTFSKSGQSEVMEDVYTVVPQDILEQVEINNGDTYGVIMESRTISIDTVNAIYEVALDYYDLVSIRAGKKLDFYYDSETNELIRLEYKINSEEELVVVKNLSSTGNGEWSAIRQDIDYELRQKVVSGEVRSSVYQAALDNDIDERAIIELANAFQWSIDFAMDPRVGDTFKFAFEERYLNGEYIMPGKILAAIYINAAEEYKLYYFEESEENKGYFDGDGNSVQKMFLKAPVAFKYISSGYTTGTRVVMEIGLVGPHRAIDYAAAYGTPIRSVGDGTVIFTGWAGCYGNKTSIRHNGTYTTNYAHQSKIIVSYGQKVKQGEVIGYVGSTGCSTGPHVHFEMVKNGVKINSLNEVLPPGKPILDENRVRFESVIGIFSSILQ